MLLGGLKFFSLHPDTKTLTYTPPPIIKDHSLRLRDYACVNVNPSGPPGWPKELWQRKGVSVRIPTLPWAWLTFAVRIPSQKMYRYISTIYNVTIAVVRIPCTVLICSYRPHGAIPPPPPPFWGLAGITGANGSSWN